MHSNSIYYNVLLGVARGQNRTLVQKVKIQERKKPNMAFLLSSSNLCIGVALLLVISLPYALYHHLLPSYHAKIHGAVQSVLSVHLSGYDESCWATCRRQGLGCDVALFELIDNCDVLRQVMPKCECLCSLRCVVASSVICNVFFFLVRWLVYDS